MDTTAVVLQEPERLALSRIGLSPPGDTDVVVEVEWSGISTGTERLLWSGRMPPFPGMGYPLVPGYETVGRVSAAGSEVPDLVGKRVFVPGARCFREIRGLFGGAASRLVVGSDRVVQVKEGLGESSVLLALAATAHHAISVPGARRPELIIGHGVLGRILARLCVLEGEAPPVVWEVNAERAADARGYEVLHPDDDPRRNYQSVYDVSGDPSLLDALIARLGRGGEIVLAGFYAEPLSFAFPPAFMREARIRVSAEWQEPDLAAVNLLVGSGRLDLDDLITHRHQAQDADRAYRTAFGDQSCLKMILDWR